MANVFFHPSALREYQAAVSWYQERSSTAARRFVAEVDRVSAQIALQPDQFGWCDIDFREAILKRFPYHVMFQVEDSGDDLIVAIAHARREPDYWHGRAEPPH